MGCTVRGIERKAGTRTDERARNRASLLVAGGAAPQLPSSGSTVLVTTTSYLAPGIPLTHTCRRVRAAAGLGLASCAF